MKYIIYSKRLLYVFKLYIICLFVCLDLIKVFRYFLKNLSLYINKCILIIKLVLFKSSLKKRKIGCSIKFMCR